MVGGSWVGVSVIVEDPTLSLLPTFSFNNFISNAFPDLAMDIDSFAYSMAMNLYMATHTIPFLLAISTDVYTVCLLDLLPLWQGQAIPLLHLLLVIVSDIIPYLHS